MFHSNIQRTTPRGEVMNDRKEHATKREAYARVKPLALKPSGKEGTIYRHLNSYTVVI